MSNTIIYENPIFFNNISKPEITYNKTNPYIKFENQILSGGIEESTVDNITLLEAKKNTLKYPRLIGFYFKIGIASENLDTTVGTAVYYLKLEQTMTLINKGSDGGSNRYTLFLKKNNEFIKETYWFASNDDDYTGGLDYINIKIPVVDISNIEIMKTNIDTKLWENTGYNAPVTTNGTLTRTNYTPYHNIEWYIYVWQEINDPWFHENGQVLTYYPNLNQIADENTGTLNCHQTNIYDRPMGRSFMSSNTNLGNPLDDIDGFKIYTHNYTTDFTADTSSNYVTVYRLSSMVGDNNGLPINSEINIIEPKFGNVYAFYTYRLIGAGDLTFDDWNDTNNLTNYIPRSIPIEGNFPFFTPGIKIDQETIDDDVGEWYTVRILQNNWSPWKWRHLTISDNGTDINNFANINAFKQFKPKRKPLIQYINQRLKVTIPPESIEDLSNNFVSRFRPDRMTPRFKTMAGDIYIHPYEYNQIINTSLKIYIFKDAPNQTVIDSLGNALLLNPEYSDEIQGITKNYSVLSTPTYVTNILTSFEPINFSENYNRIDDLILTQGNTYTFDISDPLFETNPLLFSITSEGTNNNGEEYRRGITLFGTTQGTAGSYIEFKPDNASPRELYAYQGGNIRGSSVKISIFTNNEETRDFTSNIYPYNDKFTDISADEVYTLDDNPLKYNVFPDSNFDFFDVALQDRGDWAYKDASGGNASFLVENRAQADVKVNEPTWIGYEEYTPDDVQILRPYLVDLKSYPLYVHMLNVPLGNGWFTNWKSKEEFPTSTEKIIDISDNEYYIRWSFEFHRYRYDKSNRYDPRNVSWVDISYNNGISPYTYFDFREYGKIYKPKSILMSYRRIEYPNAPETYYKNLRLSINVNEIEDLSTNVVYNTDLGAQISFQFYVIKPKSRSDRDQNDPIVDISSNLFSTYDLSFNVSPEGSQMFPPVLYVDISDTKIRETTLLPGRYIGIWSYTVQHNWVNPKARNYPLIPSVDYFSEPSYIDIGYNEFLYDNNEPIFKVPDDLSRMTLEISRDDINNLISMWNTYYKGLLSNETTITFNFLLWSPNYEYTQLLSGIRRWELPNDFIGEEDLRIKQTPVEYQDTTQIIPMQKVWLGNDNSDSSGAIYDWGFGGEPGIQYRKVTYHDISLNKVYNYKYHPLDISSGDPNVKSAAFDISQLIQFDAVDICSNDFMIEFFIPGTAQTINHVVTASGGKYYIDGNINPILSFITGNTYIFDITSFTTTHPFKFGTASDGNGDEFTNGITTSSDGNMITFIVPQTIPNTIYYYCDTHNNMGNSISITQSVDLSQNQAFWGFSNSPTDATVTTDLEMYRDNFHIGINGNGADTKWMDDVGADTFKQESFIYKPPYDPSLRTGQNHYVRYRLQEEQDNTLRYHFTYTPTRGVLNTVLQTGQMDLIIYLNGEKIFDLPDWGITLDQITTVGQAYDVSDNPVVQRQVMARFLFPDISNTQSIINDLSNSTVVLNTFVPQDFDDEDTEPYFYQSQNFVSNGLYVPYISRWEYTIYDPSNDLILESSIVQSEYANEVQRVADWQVGYLPDGSSYIQRDENYPFEHFYKYASLYSIPNDFVPPLPFYPTQNLDLSYNRVTKELVVKFDYEKIVYPLLINLQRYWVQDDFETTVTYYIYAWIPNSTKLPTNYQSVDDIKQYHLWEDDVYDISYTIVSSNPYQEVNIMPSIPYNIYTITKENLIFGKWVMAWNYRVVNDAYSALDRQRPDYIDFDVSAVEIDIPPILYDPKEPLIEHLNTGIYYENEKIKLTISSQELIDLSKNIYTQLGGLQDISSIDINYYLWTPNNTTSHNDISGWELPDGFYGLRDQRIYAAPVLYETQDNFDKGLYNTYFKDASGGEFGYNTHSALKKTISIDISGGNLMDASSVIFNKDELWASPSYDDLSNNDISGQIPFSDHLIAPYLARWSYDIVRNGVPNYTSDISDNIYYRNPYWTSTTDISGYEMIEDYDKINKYRYGNLYPISPYVEPPVIILENEGLCSCPQNEKSITKSQEATNYKKRVVTMMKNFRHAKRLRAKPASLDPRATNPNVNYKYPNTCE